MFAHRVAQPSLQALHRHTQSRTGSGVEGMSGKVERALSGLASRFSSSGGRSSKDLAALDKSQ